jgi:hypothetical protein
VVELSVIIVNWNSRDVLRKCLKSVYDTIDVTFEIIIVDNNSSDDSIAMVKKEFPQAILIARSSNIGFSKANNEAFGVSQGAYILILNPDTVLFKSAVNRMVAFLKTRVDIGIVGPRILTEGGIPDLFCKRKLPRISFEFSKIFLVEKMLNKLQVIIPYTRRALYRYYEKSEECECLAGSCMLFCRDVFGSMAGFDESVPMYLDDIDICYRARKLGLKNYYLAEAEIVHVGKYSTKTVEYSKMYDVLARQAHFFYYLKHSGRATALCYKILLALSIPYLLTLDVICAPYFILRGRWREIIWTARKHIKYADIIFSDRVINVL